MVGAKWVDFRVEIIPVTAQNALWGKGKITNLDGQKYLLNQKAICPTFFDDIHFIDLRSEFVNSSKSLVIFFGRYRS